MVAEKLQRTVRAFGDRWLRLAQCLAVKPTDLRLQVRDVLDDVLGVKLIFIALDHVLEPSALELEVHPVALDQLLVQLRVKRVGLQRQIEEALRQDMRCARVHGHRRAVGLALGLGRQHAKENHPTAQAHRFADGPQPTCRGTRGIAGALVVDQGDAQVAALGQLVRAGRANYTGTGNHDVIGLVHVRPPCPRA